MSTELKLVQGNHRYVRNEHNIPDERKQNTLTFAFQTSYLCLYHNPQPHAKINIPDQIVIL